MTLAKAKAKARENRTFTVQPSLTIVTYDRKNSLIVQATYIDIIKAPLIPYDDAKWAKVRSLGLYFKTFYGRNYCHIVIS